MIGCVPAKGVLSALMRIYQGSRMKKTDNMWKDENNCRKGLQSKGGCVKLLPI